MIVRPSEKRHVAPAAHFLRTIKCLDRRKDECLDRRKDECLDRRKDKCLDRRRDTSMSRPTSVKDKEEPSLNRDSTISAMLHTPVNLWRDLRRDLGHHRAGLGSSRGSFRDDRARFRNASLGSDDFKRGLDNRGLLGALRIGAGSWSLWERPGGGARLRTGLRRKARGSPRHGCEFRVRAREFWGI
ncbi:hypothetical protein AAC387_Pa08g1778 [Persea americana]